MKTGTAQQKITLAFINDKSLILDLICNDFVASGIEVFLRSENIKDGLYQLSALKIFPQVCVIDLDFYDRNVLVQLQELRMTFPTIKLIAHSDIDAEETVKSILKIGFAGYLLIGSDADDFKKSIEVVINGGRYFSMGVAEIAKEYFINNEITL
ncbi:response regulator transcription factor [Flavobacterium columnare]|uniref:response regulator transcription factor n=1 Tax=Flavobacterium columnare TaxID=996 RepID=UPI000D1AC044|nr:response regulator transcription factor [Flavobacterium columnare]PTD13688.1 histidine kinase [Flavobacterium columnare]